MNDLYWIASGSENKGPYTIGQIENMWKTGLITADTIYCQEGFKEWLPVASLFPSRHDALESVAGQQASLLEGSQKRILPAIILCLCLGIFGAHSFYAGRRKQGITILLLLTFPVVFIVATECFPRLVVTLFASQLGAVAWMFLVYGPMLLVAVHVLCDLVRILTGNYRDGEGLKITKWT